jgi:tripartite-type tricarboxylate transporter receptor subunit TctC
MKLRRRQFLHLAAGAAALRPAAVSGFAWAQDYPSRPVRIIVPFAPAGGTDIIARLIGQWLSERLGQQFIVENRAGGGSNIGTEAVVRAPADGYTLLVVDVTPAINATLFDQLNFNFIHDIVPVASIVDVPYAMIVNPSLPARTISEFIAYARSNPGKMNMASGGIGTGAHLFGELFELMTGVVMTHVPYRGGGPAITDLIGGQVEVYFGALLQAVEMIKAGKLRVLGVTTSTRLPAMPDIPTVGDFVPSYSASGWIGMGAPRGTAPNIVNKLNQEINTALADPKLKARLDDLIVTPMAGSPAAFGKVIADDTEKWGKVIRAGNIRPE